MGLLTGRNGVKLMNDRDIDLFCARTAELLANNAYRIAKRKHRATRRLYAAYVAAKARLCVAEVRYGGVDAKIRS